MSRSGKKYGESQKELYQWKRLPELAAQAGGGAVKVLVLDELAFTSPTSVSRPSTTWARSLLRFFFCDATGSEGG